jgi:hypothetical protein
MVGDIDPHLIALDGLDRRAVHAPVIPPASRLKTRHKLVLHLLGDEVVDLHAIHDLPGQRDVIGRDDRVVVLTRLPGRQDPVGVSPLEKRFVPLRRGAALAQPVSLVLGKTFRGVQRAKEHGAAPERRDSGEKLAPVTGRVSIFSFMVWFHTLARSLEGREREARQLLDDRHGRAGLRRG